MDLRGALIFLSNTDLRGALIFLSYADLHGALLAAYRATMAAAQEAYSDASTPHGGTVAESMRTPLKQNAHSREDWNESSKREEDASKLLIDPLEPELSIVEEETGTPFGEAVRRCSPSLHFHKARGSGLPLRGAGTLAVTVGSITARFHGTLILEHDAFLIGVLIASHSPVALGLSNRALAHDVNGLDAGNDGVACMRRADDDDSVTGDDGAARDVNDSGAGNDGAAYVRRAVNDDSVTGDDGAARGRRGAARRERFGRRVAMRDVDDSGAGNLDGSDTGDNGAARTMWTIRTRATKAARLRSSSSSLVLYIFSSPILGAVDHLIGPASFSSNVTWLADNNTPVQWY
ncbi:hypothetical protein BJY52DRAFT_1184297 [Lactarius psammicola]|nr:hypothetical protein BJY52DRAFT_1184297 [Lactarius psammicola]